MSDELEYQMDKYIPEKWRKKIKSPTIEQEKTPTYEIEKPKEPKVFTCKLCQQTFDYPYHLATHVRQHQLAAKNPLQDATQLEQIPKDLPKNYKTLKVQHLGPSTRIYSSYFLSNKWQIVKVYKPVKHPKGVWVFFEPLLVE